MKIPLFRVSTDERDVEAVGKVIRRGIDWANGPEVQELENAVAQYVGVSYCIAFNSGTSALHAALIAAKIGRGNTVAVPSFTFPATANVVLAVKATPAFIDIEDETYGMDYRKVPRSVNCMMPVHIGGCVCRDANLFIEAPLAAVVVEDAAEALGAKRGDMTAGKFGDMAMFSLCAPKIITAGEGGLLTVDDEDIRDRLVRIRDHGNPERKILGYNWRMSSITAALALSQFKRIEEMIAKRRENAHYLNICLAGMGQTPFEPEGFRHIYQMYTIRVRQKDRDPLLCHLWDNGIGAKVYFPPVHLMPLYRKLGWGDGMLPVTEQVSKEVITLPMYPDLNHIEMDYIAEVVRDFYAKR